MKKVKQVVIVLNPEKEQAIIDALADLSKFYGSQAQAIKQAIINHSAEIK